MSRKDWMSVPEGVPGLMPLVLVFYAVLKRQFSLAALHVWFGGRSGTVGDVDQASSTCICSGKQLCFQAQVGDSAAISTGMNGFRGVDLVITIVLFCTEDFR